MDDAKKEFLDRMRNAALDIDLHRLQLRVLDEELGKKPPTRSRADILERLHKELVILLGLRGYVLDYSFQSIVVLEQFMCANDNDGDLDDFSFWMRDEVAYARLGAYLGEVLCRESGGTFQCTNWGNASTITLELKGPSGVTTNPAERVISRRWQGPRFSFIDYAITFFKDSNLAVPAFDDEMGDSPKKVDLLGKLRERFAAD